jgi:mannosyltransferase
VGLALVGISALALALRLFRLDFQSFWSDEIGSLAMAGATLAESLERVGADVHPPLYFVLLHFWVALFGNSEFAVRVFSALPSALAVPVLFRLGRRLLGARAGLVAAGICALSTFQIYYAQEARSYALASFLAILSMDAFSAWRPGERAGGHRSRNALYYVVATSALLYTHYFGIFLVAVQNLWLIGSHFWGRAAKPTSDETSVARFGGWLGAQLVVAALMVPWLPTLFGQTDLVGGGDFWIREPVSR